MPARPTSSGCFPSGSQVSRKHLSPASVSTRGWQPQPPRPRGRSLRLGGIHSLISNQAVARYCRCVLLKERSCGRRKLIFLQIALGPLRLREMHFRKASRMLRPSRNRQFGAVLVCARWLTGVQCFSGNEQPPVARSEAAKMPDLFHKRFLNGNTRTWFSEGNSITQAQRPTISSVLIFNFYSLIRQMNE
jgi:hypothetical protein